MYLYNPPDHADCIYSAIQRNWVFHIGIICGLKYFVNKVEPQIVYIHLKILDCYQYYHHNIYRLLKHSTIRKTFSLKHTGLILNQPFFTDMKLVQMFFVHF